MHIFIFDWLAISHPKEITQEEEKINISAYSLISVIHEVYAPPSNHITKLPHSFNVQIDKSTMIFQAAASQSAMSSSSSLR